MVRFAVCDDEKFMLDEITVQLSLYMEEKGLPYQMEGFMSGAELLNSEKNFDVIFLDIQMEAPNGMDTAERIREKGYEGLIIFITVLKEYVFTSFEVGAYDYILKPLGKERFQKTMDRIVKSLEKNKKCILVKNHNSSQVVSVAEIVYCEVLGRKLYLHQKDAGIIDYYARLGELENSLDSRFFRCHRSYLVNLDYVKGLKPGSVLLTTNEEIPVSRLRGQELTQALLHHMKERGTSVIR